MVLGLQERNAGQEEHGLCLEYSSWQGLRERHVFGSGKGSVWGEGDPHAGGHIPDGRCVNGSGGRGLFRNVGFIALRVWGPTSQQTVAIGKIVSLSSQL